MKKLLKAIAIFVAILAIIGGLVYYFFPLEMIVQKVVNKYGSEVTGTDVNLSGFNLDVKNGEATIKDISIANPSDYKTKYAVQLGNIDIKVNLRSLTSDTIVIDKIVVNKPVISYEMMSLTQNNISDIINNINAYTASNQPVDADVKKEVKDTKENESAKKVIIKEVIISNGEINGAMTAAPDIISAAIPLPTITLNNIGETSKGTSIADSIALIIDKLLSSVSTTVISSNIANLKDAVDNTVEATTDATSSVVDSAKEKAKGVVDGAKEALDSINPFK